MSATRKTGGQALSPADLEQFAERGFVRVRRAFAPALALEMQAEIWCELAEHGIEREDRSTWRAPPQGPKRAKEHALNAEIAGPRFQTVIADLLGHDAWPPPRTWGGFLVTFPNGQGQPWNVPTETWHWDGHPRGQGLLIFTFFSEVQPGGGGTLVLDRSHRLIESFYASMTPEELAQPHRVHRKRFERWDPWLEALAGHAPSRATDRIAAFMSHDTEVRGIPTRVVELTGEPGDAVFCNPGIVHCAAPNCAHVPRLMRSKFLFLGDGDTPAERGPQRSRGPGL